MYFFFDENDDFWKERQFRDIELVIKSLMYKMPDASVKIDLRAEGVTLEESYERVCKDIEASFISRLEYKAGVSGRDDIRGFSSRVLNNNGLMQYYTPVLDGQEAGYMAQVVNYNIVEDRLYAVVNEVFTNPGSEALRLTHKVIAETVNGAWQVYSDDIVK